MEAMQPQFKLLVLGLLCMALVAPSYGILSPPAPKFFELNITEKQVTRLCSTKSIVVVNDKFPGPTIKVHEGDRLVIKVNNHVGHNITLHWHGIFQNRTGWFDGPAQITQCPIQQGKSFVYKLQITGQRGTLWWHAHITFLRATVYGALVILPKGPFPFLAPKEPKPIEHVLMLGEWWKSDVVAVMNDGISTGRGINISDAITINGMPGPLYGKCSSKDVHVFNVLPNTKYLLRIINSGMSMEFFFGIANHTLTVVEADAQYVKPFTTSFIVIAPGQTLTALLTTKDLTGSRFYMAARAFMSAPLAIPFDNTTAAAILSYPSSVSSAPVLPDLPAFNDTGFVTQYEDSLRSLKIVRDKIPVPKVVNKQLFITVGLNFQNCPTGANPNVSCQLQVPGVPVQGRFGGSMSNISFVAPQIAVLQEHYAQTHFNKTPTGYTEDFPLTAAPFNFTASPAMQNQNAPTGTKAHSIKYGSVVQIVLQGTTLLVPENHPVHLHGNDFYVLATGQGNFNASHHTPLFNLNDPPLRNTISVPAAGWAVIRFKAQNPGAWIIHCHLDPHSLTGLDTMLIVKDGVGPLQSLEPPPVDLPPC